jgi:hypothetical protein
MDARAALDVLMGAATSDPTAPPPPGFVYVKSCGNECGADARTTPMRNCVRCKAVCYCSKECQVADWPRHKPECRAHAAAVAALAAQGIQYEQRIATTRQLNETAAATAAQAAAGAPGASPSAPARFMANQ